ncbi:hypothetical protein MKK75_00545, partial [Methylobacterium sp. J-030]|uniref:hypothetical protein n=1 Tax=Methylobacterium sp. J-030 TaxID=2836627 RepID=UPI001FBA1FEE
YQKCRSVLPRAVRQELITVLMRSDTMRLNLSLKGALSAAFGLLALIAAGQGAFSILKLVRINDALNRT